MTARAEVESMKPLRVRVVTDQREFEAMRPVWNEVLARTEGGHAFLMWEWAFTWWRHFGAGDDLYIVVVEDAGDAVALAPLLRIRTGVRGLGLHIYVPIGHENADYGGLILGARDTEAAQVILDHLERLVLTSNSVVELIRIPTHSPPLEMLRERVANSPALKLDGVETLPCLYVDLNEPDDPAAYVARLAKRHDAPREYRRLARDYNTEFQYNVDWPVADAMETLFKLHERRWATRNESYGGLFAYARTQRFAVDVVEALAEAGAARLSFVVADGVPVAGSLGYEYRGLFSFHKFSFNPDFATYSPGHVIVMLLLQQAVSAKLREFNFGRADEKYKERWVNSRRGLATVTLRRSGLRGSLQRRLRERAFTKRRARHATDLPFRAASND